MIARSFRRVRPIQQLLRPLTAIAAGAAVVIGSLVADHGPFADVWLAAVSTTLLVAAANAFNDICDLDADRINRPDRPLPAGALSSRSACAFAGILAAASLAIALLVGPATAIWVACLMGIAAAYSTTLQRLGIVGHVAVAVLFANTIILGAAVSGGTSVVVWVAAIEIAAVVLGREFLKSIPDVDGDRLAGSRTIAIGFGWRGATTAFLIANGVVLVVAAASCAVAPVNVVHLAATTATVVVPAGIVGIVMLGRGPAGLIDRVLDLTCVTWLTGLLSIALLATS